MIKAIKKLIGKIQFYRECKRHGFFCPECINHDFIFEGGVFLGNRCRYRKVCGI